MSFTPNLNNWATGVTYNVNDVTTYGKNLYTCLVYHTAGTFTVDMLGGYWALVNQPVVAKNYMASANFEDGTTGMFTLFSTTLTNKIPTGAISSSPTGIYPALTAETTGAISGKYSLQTYIAGDSITAGNGIISNPITLDSEDKAKVLQISFSYSAASGANLGNFSGTSSNTWAVYVYDNANSLWIQPAGTYNIIQSNGVGKCTATFQTPSNATSVRVAIICINSNTMGYFKMLWDSFYLGPQSTSIAPSIGDWTSYTPTGSWTGNTSYSGFWRKIGDSAEFNLQVVTSTTPTPSATTLSINLPSGMVIDTLKLVASSNEANVLGIAKLLDQGNQFYRPGTVVYGTTTSIKVDAALNNTTGTTDTLVSNTVPFSWGTNDTMWLQFQVPIVGWSSNTISSADTDTRVVAASRVCGTQISIPASSYTYLDFSNMSVDTHSAWRSGQAYSAGSWATTPAYVVPVAGIYSITCGVFFPASINSKQLLITKNGASIGNGANDATTSAGASLNASAIYNFNAGDLIQIMIWQNSGSALTIPGSISAAWSHLEIQRLSGPAIATATDTIAARYTNQVATALPEVDTVLDFPAKDYDSHNAVTTGSNFRFTAPISGLYAVKVNVMTNSSNVANFIVGRIRKNGTEVKKTISTRENAVGSYLSLALEAQIRLLAGEYTDFSLYEFTNAQVLDNAAGVNSFEVIRVGNYF